MRNPKKARVKHRLQHTAERGSIESLVKLPTRVKTAMQDTFLNKAPKQGSGKKEHAPASFLERSVESAEQSEKRPGLLLLLLEDLGVNYLKPTTRGKYEDVPVVKTYMDAQFPFLHVRYGKALFDIRKVVYYNKRPAGWDYAWYDFMTKQKEIGKKLAQASYDIVRWVWHKAREKAAMVTSVYLYGWGKSKYEWIV